MRRFLRNVSQYSPVGAVLRTKSPVLYVVLAFLIGFLLVAWSLLLGIASVVASAEFFLDKSWQHGSVGIYVGYLNQMHYGLWYLLVLPMVLAVALSLVRVADNHAPSDWVGGSPKFENITSQKAFTVASWLVIVGLASLNVGEELGKFDTLGLGWVQSRGLAQCSQKLLHGASSCSLPEGLRVFIDRERKFTTSDSVRIIDIRPKGLEPPARGAIIGFTLFAKLWATFWEALLIYVGMFAVCWGWRAGGHIKVAVSNGQAGAMTELEWARRILLSFYFIGCAAALRELLRLFANFSQGSYGGWDEYLAYVTLLPGIAALTITAFLLARIWVRYADDEPLERILTKWIAAGATIFLLLVLGIGSGFLAYKNSTYLELVPQVWKFVDKSIHVP